MPHKTHLCCSVEKRNSSQRRSEGLDRCELTLIQDRIRKSAVGSLLGPDAELVGSPVGSITAARKTPAR